MCALTQWILFSNDHDHRHEILSLNRTKLHQFLPHPGFNEAAQRRPGHDGRWRGGSGRERSGCGEEDGGGFLFWYGISQGRAPLWYLVRFGQSDLARGGYAAGAEAPPCQNLDCHTGVRLDSLSDFHMASPRVRELFLFFWWQKDN